MATKARDAGKDITTAALSAGIWSDGTTMWVAKQTPAQIHAYTLATGVRDAGKDFDTLKAAQNHGGEGIWANTDTMWVADLGDDRIYSYNMPAIATNTPAAGAPAVTAPNAFRVPAVLGVDLSGVTDTDGVTNIAANATYKWQRFDATGTTLDTDSIGTDAAYTLTDTDATKTLKVVVNFTDDASNSEGPLTSAPTSAITAAASCATPTYVGGATQLGPARKLTVESFVVNMVTVHGFSVTEGEGNLENVTFTTAASNDYEIQGLNDSVFGMGITTTTPLAPVDKSTLVLHICDQDYAFAPATDTSTTPAVYFFTSPPQDWSTHAERTVYLSQDTAAPTFTSATVNGSTLVVTLSEDLGTAANLPNSAFTVKKGTSGTTQTLSGTPSISGSTVTLTLATAVTASDTAVKVTYTKPTSGSANKLRDRFSNETATFTDQEVTNKTTTTTTEVPETWSLKPTGLTAGAQFRLIFLSSTKRNASSTAIADYNTFVQGRAAAGHTDIRTYSAGFRVVGCTAAVDARDNTSTTFTTEDKGVPIYWLNGAKVADEYEDFYDGSWDDEVNDKDESGTNGLDTSVATNRPFTGCDHDGTEALDGSISQGFAAEGGAKIGRPNSPNSAHSPLSSNGVGTITNTRPMYGLSEVFQVADNTAPTVTSIERHDPTDPLTNSDTPTWRVTFSEAVKNVDGTDFTIAGTTATPTATSVSEVTGGYDVTPSEGDIANSDRHHNPGIRRRTEHSRHGR